MRAHAYGTYVEVRGEPDADKLFIVGDLGEIPNTEGLAYYKHCRPKVFQVHFLSIFYRHGFRSASLCL
jgi:hypothetical protein